MFAPSNKSASKVEDWLQQHNASEVVSCNGTVSFKMTVGKANSMLSARFQHYTNGQATKLRTTAYSVPDELAEHIGLVYPTTYFGDKKPKTEIAGVSTTATTDGPTKRQSLQGCITTVVTSPRSGTKFLTICPEGIRELYNTANYTPDSKSGSDVAFANFLGQVPSYSDLQLFEQTFGVPPQNFTTLAVLEGATDDQDPQTQLDDEADLDAQYITTVAQGLPVYSYLTGGLAPFQPDLLIPNDTLNSNEPYLPFFDYLLSQRNDDLPYVLSISYGDIENTVPLEYATRVCNQIGMLGLRGRSVLAASGDFGVGVVCRDRSPDGNLTSGKPQFDPIFPASCPYITSVGGTTGGVEDRPQESAWNATGGGFSFYFPRAWYQQNVVSGYLASQIDPRVKADYLTNEYVNFSGRAYPDLAAHSFDPYVALIINSTVDYIGGTSASTPIVAGVIALLNDARFRAGRPAMGFLNPWLYSAGRNALTDITTGGAIGCNGTDQFLGEIPGAGVIPYASFNATPGESYPSLDERGGRPCERRGQHNCAVNPYEVETVVPVSLPVLKRCQSYLAFVYGNEVDLDPLTGIAADDLNCADMLYTGWDPSTGFGTPNFEKMKKAALDVFDWHVVPQPVWDCPPAGGWGWKNEY